MLVIGVVVGTAYQTDNVRDLKAAADSIGKVRLGDQRAADRREDQLRDSLELSEDRRREAEEKAERAARRLAWQEQETAALTVTVIETNTGCPPEHIVADSLLALSNESEKAYLREMLDASASISATWEMRYRVADVALQARKMECQTCQEEVAVLTKLANPGWFTRFRRNIVPTVLTIGGTLLVVASLG